ncbi:hypothetical protein GCM10025869_30410 [Homoserinibacter gongjuensis]|uniref:MGS-like domain-containing protein n=1 Tax=Homoserinibacter gongjuensis TaxID=1162968 RepID=A0ABQ6JXW8_9MICO|nr:hypothetical protein GCM10025869_30410 [Homoserinibacter gongjuensis]
MGQGGGEDTVIDLINTDKIDIVINTPSGRSARADGVEIRTATVAADKPLFTTIAQLGAAVGSSRRATAPSGCAACRTTPPTVRPGWRPDDRALRHADPCGRRPARCAVPRHRPARGPAA